MIAKISSGKDTTGLISYLYGPGRANEHTDPHLVASFDGYAPDPGRTSDPAATRKLLVADLDLRVHQARRLGRVPARHVWHCSIRAAKEDRHLADEEWADIARRIVHATGIAPAGDLDGCRWVAVRHAEDHIHIAATTVRGDLRPARHWNDYLTADRELITIEKEYDLRQVARGDRTAPKRPTRAETEKARRTGQPAAARERLRSTVRTAVAASTSPEEFLGMLGNLDGVLVQALYFPSGDVRGYKVALEGDTNTAGEPIWYSGSKLAPDLSYPQIHDRLTNTTHQPARAHEPNAWHEAALAAEQIHAQLDTGDDAADQPQMAAFGEALDALPLLVPAQFRPQLRQAAAAFERASRSRTRAEHHHARALRGAIRAMRTQPAPGDGALLAMFLDAAILVTVAAARWHQLRHHNQQVTATRQTLLHLHAAYDQASTTPIAILTHRKPPPVAVERFASLIRQTLPAHARHVLDDPAWPALATALAQAEATRQEPAGLLRHAVDQRTLDDARSPARTITWRLHRLTPQASATAPPTTARRDRLTPSRAPTTRPIAAAVNEASRRR